MVARHVRVGESGGETAAFRLPREPAPAYGRDRDRPDRLATSRLSENLTWGEISCRQIWAITRRNGGPGTDAFLRELAWREFAWHLLHHFPKLARSNWRAEWSDFPWRPDNAMPSAGAGA